jgi:hypothetical protein
VCLLLACLAAVTPFSEYKLRLGIAIMIEDRIQPKTAAAVRAFIGEGGKLRVGGDVLVGLERWETLVDKPADVDTLLANMRSELDAALQQGAKFFDSVPASFNASQTFTALGFQAKGMEFVKAQLSGAEADVTPLILAPHVLHRQPLTLPAGTRFAVVEHSDPAANGRVADIVFDGFGSAANGDLTLSYLHEGHTIMVTCPDPNAKAGASAGSGPRRADKKNAHEYVAYRACEFAASSGWRPRPLGC